MKFHFRILPILYYNRLSPPSRLVLLVAKILNIGLELSEVDIEKKQQMDPEFIEVKSTQLSILTIQFVIFVFISILFIIISFLNS